MNLFTTHILTGFLFLQASLPANFLPSPAREIIHHKYYTLSYNEPYEQANWVMYQLTDSMVLKSEEERSNSFKMDKLVSTISAKSSDYTNSGYDRGHLCPAADMGFSSISMQESFYMSNISPQIPEFNRGIWKELESTVRKWAIQEHQLYVVTGPVFKDNKGYIGQEQVLIPGYFFKVIYDATAPPKMIAFLLPNEKSIRPILDFVVKPDEVEQITGFDFFSNLPDSLEHDLEGKAQLAGWFVGYEQEETPLAAKPIAVKPKVDSDVYFYLSLATVIVLVIIVVSIKKWI